MTNKKTFLVTGLLIACLIALVPFLGVYITSGDWNTTNAFGAEGAVRLLIFTSSFIASLLTAWRTFYLYFKE